MRGGAGAGGRVTDRSPVMSETIACRRTAAGSEHQTPPPEQPAVKASRLRRASGRLVTLRHKASGAAAQRRAASGRETHVSASASTASGQVPPRGTPVTPGPTRPLAAASSCPGSADNTTHHCQQQLTTPRTTVNNNNDDDDSDDYDNTTVNSKSEVHHQL